MDNRNSINVIRFLLFIFLLAILFGLSTVLFVEMQTELLNEQLGPGTFVEEKAPFLSEWVGNMYESVSDVYEFYPLIAYCMDWLSYACVVFVIFMIGAIKDPIKNKFIVQVFMLACLLGAVLPFIAGPFREIPIFWRFIDGSFGIMGFLFLCFPYKMIRKLERAEG